MKNEAVLILDFGGQYSQLIARRVRDCHVYCEIRPYHTPLETIRGAGYKGIIFSGGPNSVYEKGAPGCP
ncbi:MAG TPA: GMP synthase (glutamine-hydrolyzing), partial [Ruminococcaceae bacterium]|nr:GMP synthase (glutamine-hydrolyzing) [Oscillospiraceae bacterium]